MGWDGYFQKSSGTCGFVPLTTTTATTATTYYSTTSTTTTETGPVPGLDSTLTFYLLTCLYLLHQERVPRYLPEKLSALDN